MMIKTYAVVTKERMILRYGYQSKCRLTTITIFVKSCIESGVAV